MLNPELSVPEGDLVSPVGMSCSHALLGGGNPRDLKSPNNTEEDVPCDKDGGNNDPSTPDLRRCPMNTLLDHVLTAEDAPGCATCNKHIRLYADQCCARFTKRLKKRNDIRRERKHHLTQAHKESKVTRMLSRLLASG